MADTKPKSYLKYIADTFETSLRSEQYVARKGKNPSADTLNFWAPIWNIGTITKNEVSNGWHNTKGLASIGVIVSSPLVFAKNLVLQTAKAAGNLANAAASVTGAVCRTVCSVTADVMHRGADLLDKAYTKITDLSKKEDLTIAQKIGTRVLNVVASPIKAVAAATHIAATAIDGVGNVLEKGCKFLGAAAKAVANFKDSASWNNLKNSFTNLVAAGTSLATGVAKQAGRQVDDLGMKLNIPVVSHALCAAGKAVEYSTHILDGAIQAGTYATHGKMEAAASSFREAKDDIVANTERSTLLSSTPKLKKLQNQPEQNQPTTSALEVGLSAREHEATTALGKNIASQHTDKDLSRNDATARSISDAKTRHKSEHAARNNDSKPVKSNAR